MGPVWIQRQRGVRKTAGLLVWLNILGRKWRPRIIRLCEFVDSAGRRLRALGIWCVPHSGSHGGRPPYLLSLSAAGGHSGSARCVDAAGQHSLVTQPARLWTSVSRPLRFQRLPAAVASLGNRSVFARMSLGWPSRGGALRREELPLLFTVLHLPRGRDGAGSPASPVQCWSPPGPHVGPSFVCRAGRHQAHQDGWAWGTQMDQA